MTKTARIGKRTPGPLLVRRRTRDAVAHAVDGSLPGLDVLGLRAARSRGLLAWCMSAPGMRRLPTGAYP